MLRWLPLVLVLAGCSAGNDVLRVCADPNNLPFSNRAGQGFENKIAEAVAAELGRKVAYTWWAQRRGMVREALNAGKCDLVPGTAAGLEMLATTPAYYRSSYVAVTRAGDPPIRNFDDPRLRSMRIGVQMIGDDFANTPPAHALTERGIVGNVRGYMIYGDYARDAPQAEIVEALASGEIDVAFVWGPVAGYFAPRQPLPLRWEPLAPEEPAMAFGVAMGVRRGDAALKNEVQRALAARARAIENILRAYGVPLLSLAPASAADSLED
jgi:mxaJ protein